MIELGTEWSNWLRANIQRRTSPDAMIKAMISAGFDAATATFVVTQAISPSMPSAIPTPKTAYVPPFPSAGRPVSTYQNDVIPVAAGNRIDVGDRVVTVETRIDRPCVIVFNNVLSDEECDTLIKLSRPRLKPSSTVDPVTGKLEVTGHRISEGMSFRRCEDEFITRIEQRIAKLMNCPIENGEGLAILHYNLGQQYHPHFDYFPPQNPGSQKRMAVGGQRVSTLITYLNDVEEGGETFFPDAGISVCPRKGAAVYFLYCNAQGHVDPLSLHGGKPVVSGEKWIVTKWMRQRPFG
ncbi:MAG TPA: 2OG-Fe(II) oxygenase [Rhodocyclaceae bacterium]|nr:2OG-Fe(II) oxygenase [Rhodocyclaceae bacterium]